MHLLRVLRVLIKELQSLENKKGYLLFEAIVAIVIVSTFVALALSMLSITRDIDTLHIVLDDEPSKNEPLKQSFYTKEFY